ncbi:methylated-DNA--[protein]-cysteine S-methyltransferase [Planctomicrobium sp. SH661]|uniref:methylated-DNA--[protein]-cysteine S-methyltransferase n=1 Tax=Planctomicrobium sp. SH661 TaxID=3448124 RepID=UPI003F5C0A49
MQRSGKGNVRTRNTQPGSSRRQAGSKLPPENRLGSERNSPDELTSTQLPFLARPCVFETSLGWMGFVGTERGMTALTFGHDSPDDVYERLSFESLWNFLPSPDEDGLESGLGRKCSAAPSWMQQAEELLTAYAAGEPVELSSIPCDLPAGTRFEQRVREQLAKIGYGQTITYGQLAEAAGAPRAARAVGSVMARNSIPLVIACHRVVGASGKLCGYSASEGLSMKERLLQMEQSGVPVR